MNIKTAKFFFFFRKYFFEILLIVLFQKITFLLILIIQPYYKIRRNFVNLEYIFKNELRWEITQKLQDMLETLDFL